MLGFVESYTVSVAVSGQLELASSLILLFKVSCSSGGHYSSLIFTDTFL